MRRIECLTCHTIITSGDRVTGCGCDSDAPTWCALDGDRILAFSYSTWREMTDEQSHNQPHIEGK
jgi:hypothetical protein